MQRKELVPAFYNARKAVFTMWAFAMRVPAPTEPVKDLYMYLRMEYARLDTTSPSCLETDAFIVLSHRLQLFAQTILALEGITHTFDNSANLATYEEAMLDAVEELDLVLSKGNK